MSMFRTAAVIAAALAAVPAAAAPPPPPVQVHTIAVAAGPLAATLGGKRYSLRLQATQPIRNRSTTLTLTFTRTVGSASQVHEYSFVLPRRGFSCRGRRLQCVVDSGRSLGRFGHVRLAVSATGRRRAGALHSGCKGSATRTAAVATAEIRFGDASVAHAHSAGSRRRVRASIRGIRETCSAATFCHTQILGVGGDDPTGAFALIAPASGPAQVQLTFALPENQTAPASVQRSVIVRSVSPASFTIAPDLSAASFSADGLPFLSGSITYAARTTSRQFGSGCGIGSATLGGVTGDVAALFDGIGRRPLLATGGHLETIP